MEVITKIPRIIHIPWMSSNLSVTEKLSIKSIFLQEKSYSIIIHTRNKHISIEDERFLNSMSIVIKRINTIESSLVFLAYEILDQYGGIWINLGTILIRPLEETIDLGKVSIVINEYGNLIMSSKKNKLIEFLLKEKLTKFTNLPSFENCKVFFNDISKIYSYSMEELIYNFPSVPSDTIGFFIDVKTPNCVAMENYYTGTFANVTKFNGIIPKLYLSIIPELEGTIPPKKISIVMGYKDRKQQLLVTLKSISMSDYPNIEIIIVNDDESDDLSDIGDLKYIYGFSITVIKHKMDKDVLNPCVTYNEGFKHATGEIILIQNPECCHVGDVLSYIGYNLKKTDYFVVPCLFMDKPEYNDIVKSTINDNVKWNGSLCNIFQNSIANKIWCSLSAKRKGWVVHPVYSQYYLHFMSAIYRSELEKLGGFDERFKNGICYDDDDLARDIRFGLCLDMKILPLFPENPHKEINVYCIHQWHKHFNYKDVQDKVALNKELFIKKHKEILEIAKTDIKYMELFSDGKFS